MAATLASPSTKPSLLLGPWSGHAFQNFQGELNVVWYKGLGTRPGATPEPAERAPHLTPRGSKLQPEQRPISIHS